MIRMKKLVSSGVSGANEGYVPRGREFTVTNEQRAKDLEDAGLAYRLEDKTLPQSTPLSEIVAPSNKAADAGPLASVGGTIGADVPAPSSPPDRAPRRRRLNRSKDDLLS